MCQYLPVSGDPAAGTGIVLRPHVWYLGTAALATFASASLIWIWFDIGSVWVPWGSSIGVTVALATTLRLRLHPAGLSIQHADARWDQLQISRGPFGHRLRVPPAIEPRRRHRIKLYLPMWEPNWRDGAIGAHLARYAPDLLAQAD